MGAIIAPRLRPGETWASWFDRGAARARTTLSNYAATLGIHRDVEVAFRAPAWGVDASDPVIDRLTTTTSATSEQLRASLLVSLRGVCLPTDWTYGPGTGGPVQGWVYPASTGVCPRCVGEADLDVDGGYISPLTAKTPWHFACLRHDGILLRRCCPACGHRIGSGRSDGSPFPSQPHRHYTPGTCRSSSGPGRTQGRRGWTFCGHNFAGDEPLGAIQPDTHAWHSQTRLLAALHGLPLTTAIGADLEAFEQLRNLSAFTLATIDQADIDQATAAGDHPTAAMLAQRLGHRAAAAADRAAHNDGRNGRRVRTWLTPPTEAAALAWAVPRALALADLDDGAINEAGRRLRSFGGNHHMTMLRRYGVPDELAQPVHRLAVTKSVGVTGPAAPDGPLFGSAGLPLLLDADDYTTRYRPLIADLALRDTTARTAITLCLVRRATGDTWAAIAARFGIGLDAHGRVGVVANMLAKIQAARRMDALDAAISAHAADLAQADSTIDWDQRRASATAWTPYEPALSNIYLHAGITPTPARRRHLAAWLWAEHTGNPWNDAPIYGPTGPSNGDKETARRWRTTTLPRLDLSRTDPYDIPPPPGPRFGPERLPRLYPTDCYQTVFAPLLEPCRTTEVTGRQVVTTAVLAAADHHLAPAGHYAAAVGIHTASRGRYAAHDWIRHELARRHTIDGFDAAIAADTARIADSAVDVDWAARRDRYGAWSPPRRDSDRIYTAAGLRPTATRHTNLSARAWEQCTGNPWFEAPVWSAPTASDNERSVYQAWRRTLLPKLATALAAYVEGETARPTQREAS
jgi:hypothetical protein